MSSRAILWPGITGAGERHAEAERARALRRAGGQDRDVVGGVRTRGAVAESSMGSA